MFGFTTTRRLRTEVAAAKDETDRQRQRAETAEGHAATAVYNRKQTLRQNADLNGRNKELQRRLDTAHDNQPGDTAETMRLEARVERLKKVAARLHSALRTAHSGQAIAAASIADQQAIAAWERRVKAHDRWLPHPDPDKRPIGGGTSRPTHPATELRRTQERCLELEALLAVAEGRTRKGVAS